METSSENSLIPMDPILVEAKQASTSAEAKQTASRKRPRPVKTYRCRGTKDKSVNEHNVTHEQICKDKRMRGGVATICKDCTSVNNTNRNKLFNGTLEILLSRLISSMKSNTKQRNEIRGTLRPIPPPDEPAMKKLLFEAAKNKMPYTVETSNGLTATFPIVYVPGCFNSPSLDRIKDAINTNAEKVDPKNLGYTAATVEVVPGFLNTPYALKAAGVREIIDTRLVPRTDEQLDLVASQLVDGNSHDLSKNYGFLYKMSHHAGKRAKRRREKGRGSQHVRTGTTPEFAKFLRDTTIQHACRSPRTFAPIYPNTTAGAFKMSVDRLDDDQGYTHQNSTVDMAGLNSRTTGQLFNARLTPAERTAAKAASKVTQEYLDTALQLTPERRKECEAIVAYESAYLRKAVDQLIN